MLSLHTNSASLAAQNAISMTQKSLSTSQTRLSTGYRVNSSMDDAAGLQIATRLKAQTSGMAVAMRNTQNSISMMQTAEGALQETTNILTRMKDLATQAADGSSTATDQTAIQSEYDTLSDQLGNIISNTTFGGTKLLNNTSGTFAVAGGVKFQIGSSSSETTTVDLSTQMSTATGLDGALTAVSARYNGSGTVSTTAGTEMTAAGGANAEIDKLSTAIDAVSTVKSALGAASNSLDHVYNNLSNISTNTQAATGRLVDVDFAAESSNMTQSQMLLQAGTAMLKQSNSISSLVISLLQ
ncbi:flagellin [Rugamonas sp.]|uniref:flagellin N-terminal helical domain-containing protein n=1 Tax=Rugamonas sp. TaxID=1926287 RepID=UPI0025F8C194|nr:flagellin [Rugamonas sp.]